jgi:uncharacterized phage protein gp47/JayE
MVYEDMTYEVILKRMMDRVSTNYPNLDTREGSILFNALAPAAVELAIMYTELDNALKESFINTASREYILLACEQMGMDISRFEATAGVHKGLFDVTVPIGSRWNCDLYNYVVTDYLGIDDSGYHAYRMTCESVGSSPNNQVGDLVAITDIPSGLTFASLVECLIEGENETSDDDIRTAYYEYINSTASDGNVNQYKRWCSEYDGIGNSKIFPLWKGANTVKVSILSASNRAASKELISEFQEYLDPGITGMGDGVAPIGAFVTVTTATELPINVQANITMKSGYSNTNNIATALDNYFSSIAYNKSQVAYMTIGATILGVEGVESISNLRVNNGTADISLTNEQIPVLGTTNWVVS